MANSLWAYSDWITLTGMARLTRLRLHIQEVSEQILETHDTVNGVRVGSVPDSYLNMLRNAEANLATRLEDGVDYPGGGRNLTVAEW